MNKLILIVNQYIPYGCIPEVVYFESDKPPSYWNDYYQQQNPEPDTVELGLNSKGEFQHYSPDWDFESIIFEFMYLDEFLKLSAASCTPLE